MKTVALAGLLAITGVSSAWAGSDGGRADRPNGVHCEVKADKDDVVRKGQTVVIEAGQKVKDAVALEGDVVIKKGARVKSAVAINGSVTVESGATVTENVVAVGGELRIAPGARVQGSRVSLGKTLHLIDEDGQEVTLGLEVNGESLGQKLVREILAEVKACRIES